MTRRQDIAGADSATDTQWEKWGSQNPYRGVLGIDTSSLNADSKAKFFESGREHVHDMLSMIQDHFGGPCPSGRALDFGCGVGRLLIPLAGYFSDVVGVDVSRSMLSVARENTANLSHVELVHGLDALQDTKGGFDLVHSYIVMQHIRPIQGMKILERLISLVRPNGFLAVHLTIGDQRPWRRRLNAIRYRIRPVHWLYNLSRRRPFNEPVAEMNRYDTAAVFDLLRRKDLTRVLTVPLDQAEQVGIILIARKRA